MSSPSAGTGGMPAAGVGGVDALMSSPSAGVGGMLPAGAGGTSGAKSPSSATSAEECVYRGGGGADAVPCRYVNVEFSDPLPSAGLQIEVTTSDGEVLVPTTEGSLRFNAPPALLLLEDSTDSTRASGFALEMIAGNDYSPEWVDVVVRRGDTTAGQSRLQLAYSCVALTSDDWCWKAGTNVLEVTRSTLE